MAVRWTPPDVSSTTEASNRDANEHTRTEVIMKTWTARILIAGKGGSVPIQVQARRVEEARKIILAQYPGDTRITSGPTEVR